MKLDELSLVCYAIFSDKPVFIKEHRLFCTLSVLGDQGRKGTIMKIKYEFATETTEIEVSEEWGSILLDLDRQEYNINHKETRRHCSLEAFNLDGNLFQSDDNLEKEIIEKDLNLRLNNAIQELTDAQKKRFLMYMDGKTYREIAKAEGVDHKQIIKSIEQARKKLKNFII